METIEKVTPLKIKGIHSIEFCAQDPIAMVEQFELLGFDQIAYAGRANGRKYAESYVVKQGRVPIIISGSLRPDSAVALFLKDHGDGVRDITFEVPNVPEAYHLAMEREAISIARPEQRPRRPDKHGYIMCAAIHAPYGDVVHTFIDTSKYSGVFVPGFSDSMTPPSNHVGVGIECIDHLVTNVGPRKMGPTAKWYNRVFGLEQLIRFNADQIKGKHTALMSMVMWDGSEIRLPINEPALEQDTIESQISEYLRLNRGEGIQHIAFQTNNLIETATLLRAREFCLLPAREPWYYEQIRKLFHDIPEVDIDTLARLGLLADRDDKGYLIQVFSKPIIGGNAVPDNDGNAVSGNDGPNARKVVFLEFLQRCGSVGFGERNFGELFKAMEDDQIESARLSTF